MRNSDSSSLIPPMLAALVRPVVLALASAALPGILLLLLLAAPTITWAGSPLWIVGIVVAALLTVLTTIFTLHYFSHSQEAHENAELARKLSLIQNATRQVMLEFDQQNAVRTACQTAMAISQADKAALFLLKGQELVLTGSVGVPAVHLMTRPYKAEAWNGGGLRVVNNTATLAADVLDTSEFRAFAEIPLQENGTFLGHLTVYHHQPHTFTDTELKLLSTLGSQIFAALNLNEILNQRLQREVQWQLEQLALMEGIIQQISGGRDFNEVISRVLDTAARTTGADMAALAMVTEADDLWVIRHEYENGHAHKYHQSQTNRDGIIGHTIQTGTTQLIPNNQQIPYYLPSATQTYRSSLCVPLQKDGQVIGVLAVESQQIDFFTEEQAIFLKNLGAHATITIHNTRLLEELQYQIGTLTSLRELTLKLSSAVETGTVANAILETALHILQAQYAVLFHYDETFKKLILLDSLELAAPPQTEQVVTILRQTAYQAVREGEIQTLDR
ncbi:MAG TPA: GAF domain-containing protein, partial [Phototrophicaceae bacterium]|nr:GAF domain-containing protein [Phototrophicaceae bacterium]